MTGADPRDQLRDISLLGSGSLQIIEILLDLYLDPVDLNLVLLDEPNSHIHRDIQRRLLETIEDRADRAQVFLTTHNEAMIRSAGWDRVFHLEPTTPESPREFYPVGTQPIIAHGRHQGLVASPLRGTLSSMGAESALDLLNALEADLFLLVEGSSDATVVDHILHRSRLAGAPPSAMYWNLGGFDNGIHGLRWLKALLGSIKNHRSLWEKATLVLDRDLLTPHQANDLAQRLATDKGFQIRTTFWEARTVESVLCIQHNRALVDSLLHLTPPEIKGFINVDGIAASAWGALEVRLTERDGSNAQVAGCLPQLQQRRKLLESVGLKGVLIGDDATLLRAVLDFQRDAVRAGRFHEVADKYDVRFYVHHILTKLHLTEEQADEWLSNPAWFRAIIGRLDNLRDVPALQSMQTVLTK